MARKQCVALRIERNAPRYVVRTEEHHLHVSSKKGGHSVGCGEEEVTGEIDTRRVKPLGAAVVLAANHRAKPAVADGTGDGGRRREWRENRVDARSDSDVRGIPQGA